jgi:release factor glutamine methyltransferase
MTVVEALRAATTTLAATSDTARLDAEVLLAHALGVARSELLLRQMDNPAPAAFTALIDRRLAHEPVAYIVGEAEFFGRPFLVSPAVLIPRSDSEVLVEAALKAMPQPDRVLDCGTGSGALLLSLLAERPGTEGIGTDRSLDALQVAAANAARLGLSERARFLRADWDEPGWANSFGQFDLILANPPYVEDLAELAPSVRAHEPAGALFAGPEGLDAYRVLIPQLPALLAPNGAALVEIGATQAAAVTAIAAAVGLSALLHRDLGGRARVFTLQIPLGKPSGAA